LPRMSDAKTQQTVNRARNTAMDLFMQILLMKVFSSGKMAEALRGAMEIV